MLSKGKLLAAAYSVFFFLIFIGFIKECKVYGLDSHITWDDIDECSTDEGNVIVVDKTGKGDSLTVQGAIDMVPEHNTQRVKILILPGIYREKVVVPASKPYISLIGNPEEVSDTSITWDDKATDDDDGHELGTFKSASVTIGSDYFCAYGITFENTAEKCQAVALRIYGDKTMMYRVRVLGSQDTLLDQEGSHYFYQCYIQGAVDFIFGRATSIYEDCILYSTAEKAGAIAAHHRDLAEDESGFSFVNCTIKGSGHILLGRAWGEHSRIVYSQCYMENIISPAGWSDWGQPERQKTAVFGEYECWGKGAKRKGREPWSKSLSYEEARQYMDKSFINGHHWLKL